MQTHTVQILETTLRTDSTVTPEQRKAILKAIRGEPMPAPDGNGNTRMSRIHSRKQAAEMLGGKSLRYIDKLTRLGQLEKFVPHGNRRAIGVTAESLERFLEGGV